MPCWETRSLTGGCSSGLTAGKRRSACLLRRPPNGAAALAWGFPTGGRALPDRNRYGSCVVRGWLRACARALVLRRVVVVADALGIVAAIATGGSARARRVRERGPVCACGHAKCHRTSDCLKRARRAGERGPAWACRHARVIEDAASPDARGAPESVAWPGVGLQTRTCRRRCGFSRHTRCAGERGPAWASRHARVVEDKRLLRTHAVRRRAWPSVGLQTRTCHRRCGFSRRTRCAEERGPAWACRHARVVEERLHQTRAMRRRVWPAWASRHARVVKEKRLLRTHATRRRAWPSVSQRLEEPADVEAVHDLGPKAVESAGGHARVPRLSPRGLVGTYVPSKMSSPDARDALESAARVG